jgi:hypothetical protein
MNTELADAFSDLGWNRGKNTLLSLKNGLDPNLVNDLGEPLVLAAARSGCWDVFEVLLSGGADPMAQSPQGHTAYHYAIAGVVRPNWRYWSQQCIRDSRKIAQTYFKNGLLDARDQAIYAMAFDRVKDFERLLKEGLDANSRFPDPSRVLFPPNTLEQAKVIARDAAKAMKMRGLKERLEKVLVHETKIQTASRKKSKPAPDPTLLMWSNAIGRTSYSAILLAAGADTSLKDELGYTCHSYAVLNHRTAS